MKFLLSLFLLCGLSAKAQCFTNVTVVAPSAATNIVTFTVDTNQLCRIPYMRIQGSANITIRSGLGQFVYSGSDLFTNFLKTPTIVGPATITASGSTTTYAMFTAELSTPCVEVHPTGSVIIPTEPAGNTEVILESSPDLLNWTAAMPGVYGSGTTNKFFRVRAQRI